VNRLIKQTYIFGHLPEINISKADCDKIWDMEIMETVREFQELVYEIMNKFN
jgi:hypothetical protein